MNYDPIKGVIQISPKEAEMAARSLRWAMKHIRLAGKLPLTRINDMGCPMTDVDFAQSGIMDAAKYLGIDLGGERAENLDLSGE